MYFDTHAHYDDDAFDLDREAVLAGLPAAGVTLVVNPGCDVASSRSALALAAANPHVYAAVGIHPENCGCWSEADLAAIREMAAAEKAVAIGEIGLDYHWAENPPKEEQQAVFRRQLELARELDLPVIVHDRDAHGDCLALVAEFPGLRGVFHCYSGSAEMAKRLLELGWYLGFDGPVTYPKARKAQEVAAVTPVERMLLETDAPYLPPVPHRGKRNDSRYLPHVAETLAGWKGLETAALCRITAENGRRLFGIKE